MYQQSVDRSHGSSKSDLILFIVLVAAFFLVGAIVLYLENRFSSTVPRYVFIGAVLACLYAVYRLRLIGYRYTAFYEEPKPVYDETLGETIIHEDYPYPVGTLVFERIISAKGVILFSVDKADIVALFKPGEDPAEYRSLEKLNLACRKAEQSHSLIFNKDGKRVKLYFDPDEKYLQCIRVILGGENCDPSSGGGAE